MDTNRINEINAKVHQCTDLDGALSVYNLLKSNGYEIKSIPYEIKMGEYAEYHAKNQELFDMIIDLFYEPVN